MGMWDLATETAGITEGIKPVRPSKPKTRPKVQESDDSPTLELRERTAVSDVAWGEANNDEKLVEIASAELKYCRETLASIARGRANVASLTQVYADAAAENRKAAVAFAACPTHVDGAVNLSGMRDARENAEVASRVENEVYQRKTQAERELAALLVQASNPFKTRAKAKAEVDKIALTVALGGSLDPTKLANVPEPERRFWRRFEAEALDGFDALVRKHSYEYSLTYPKRPPPTRADLEFMFRARRSAIETKKKNARAEAERLLKLADEA